MHSFIYRSIQNTSRTRVYARAPLASQVARGPEASTGPTLRKPKGKRLGRQGVEQVPSPTQPRGGVEQTTDRKSAPPARR